MQVKPFFKFQFQRCLCNNLSNTRSFKINHWIQFVLDLVHTTGNRKHLDFKSLASNYCLTFQNCVVFASISSKSQCDTKQIAPCPSIYINGVVYFMIKSINRRYVTQRKYILLWNICINVMIRLRHIVQQCGQLDWNHINNQHHTHTRI